MIGSVIVMEPDDYQAWLSSGTEQPLAARGEQLFQQLACHSCHVNDGSGRGPSLAGLFGRQVEMQNGFRTVANDSYIRESILQPQAKMVKGYGAIMPTFQGQVSEESVMSIIEYIKSLPAAGAVAAATQTGQRGAAAVQPAAAQGAQR
jgi:cytochrome c oxidase subunit 2